MKRIGIILELNEKKAIVMASNAEFITIKCQPGMYVGAPVELNPLIHPIFAFLRFKKFATHARSLRNMGLAGLTLTAVLILAFFFKAPFYVNTNQYAYITVDINPSVELILDTKITVTEVRSINEDSRSLLKGISLLNMPLTHALLTLVNRAEQENYFTSETERYILVSTATKDISPEKPELLEAAISQCNTELIARNIQMQCIRATLSERQIALENHLSTGRYALFAYTQDTGPKINLETAKTETVGRLLAVSGLLTNSSHSTNTNSIAQVTASEVLENLVSGNSNIQPSNHSKQEGITAADQTVSEKLTPALPNPFIVSSSSIPTLTSNLEVTVTPKPYIVMAEDTRLAAAIASAYQINVSGQDIAGLRESQSFGYGEIGLLFGLANTSGKTIADILAMRQSDLSWGEIAKSLGIKIAAITRKNSSVLKAAEMAGEDQKLKKQLNQEEKKENSQTTPKPTKADQENSNANSHSSTKDNSGHGKNK